MPATELVTTVRNIAFVTNIILEALHLRKLFGRLVAVDDVSLRVSDGTVHSIIGPNGAGKTTFFNLLTGKYRTSAGRVMFKGQDITSVPFHRRAHLGIGRSFQITNIFPNLTVLENVRLAAQALSQDSFHFFRSAGSFRAHIQKASDVLAMVGLTDLAAVHASILPHGAKRKLELAILLATGSELLLLDEPTAGMASEQVSELIQIIDLVRQQGNKTIVLVEHNMNVVMSISDRITVMNSGTVLAEGTPSEISQNSQVQKVYLGELYDFPGVAVDV
jgi:branched-chain amino acid transport system ATP-binding protein